MNSIATVVVMLVSLLCGVLSALLYVKADVPDLIRWCHAYWLGRKEYRSNCGRTYMGDPEHRYSVAYDMGREAMRKKHKLDE